MPRGRDRHVRERRAHRHDAACPDAQLRDGDELVIVDNASKDGTAAAVREAAPSAQLLEQRDNLGFAGGCNPGARAAHAPLLLFLNPDAVPAPGCLDALSATRRARRDWGAWQALVTMAGGSTINTSGGTSCTSSASAGPGAAASRSRRPRSAPTEVSFASGAALCVRREAWEALERLRRALLHVRRGSRPGPAAAARGHGVGHRPGRARASTTTSSARATASGSCSSATAGGRSSATTRPVCSCRSFRPCSRRSSRCCVIAARGGWLGAKLRAQATVVRELPQILRQAAPRAGRKGRRGGRAGEAPVGEPDNPYLGRAGGSRPLALLQRAYWRVVTAGLAAGRRMGAGT